jgi:hypothetical protein
MGHVSALKTSAPCLIIVSEFLCNELRQVEVLSAATTLPSSFWAGAHEHLDHLEVTTLNECETA